MTNSKELQDLPIEVIYLILSNVSSDEIITKFQFTSKYIYHLCSDEIFWKLLSTSQYKNSPKLKSKFQNGNQVITTINNLNLDEADTEQQQQLNNNSNNNNNSWKYFFIKSRIPSYLIIGSEIEDVRISELRNQLYGMGLKSIEHLNVFGFKSLSINDLYKYDAILFFSYCGFRQKSIGNILSEFVDSGGGCVVACYSNAGKGNHLGGNWLENNYNPFKDGTTQRVSNLKIGTRNQPDHPILHKVNSFGGSTLSQVSHSDSLASDDSTVIAEWSNGRPLIIELSTKQSPIIGLNFYPPSNDFDITSWDKNTDGLQIIYNSLKYVSSSNKQQ